MRSLTLTKGREIKDATKEDNEGLEKVEEVTVGDNIEDNIKEESMEGGLESWKQPKSEANKELRDGKKCPNELNSGNISS